MENQITLNQQGTQANDVAPLSHAPTRIIAKLNLLQILITVVVSAIIFGVGGYYLGTQSVHSGNDISSKELTSNEPSIPQTSPSAIVNSKVLTYSEEDYQFSFQYPKDWKLNCTKPQDDNWLDRNICDITAPETSLDNGQLDSGAYFVIGVSKPNPNYSNFQEYIQYSVDQRGYKATPKTVNNIQGYELISSTNSVFVFDRKDHFISVGGIPLETTKPYYLDIQDIISSFKLNYQ